MVGSSAVSACESAYGGTLPGVRDAGRHPDSRRGSIHSGGQEEIGWRGIAQPLVEGRYGMFIGGAVVGVFWVLWHLPLLTSTTLPFESTNPMVFGFQTVGIAVLLAWLYQRSGQSLILAMLFHGWRNSIEAFYPIDMLARSIAVVIHLGCRTRCGSRRA